MGASEQVTPELVARCKEGDEDAWKELWALCHEDIARWLARVNHALSAEDIADLRQEVFRKVAGKLSKYRPEYSFRGWLYQQTSSLAIDHHRAKKTQKRAAGYEAVSLDEPIDQDGNVREVVTNADGPDQIAVAADEHHLLQQSLTKLGPPDSRCRKLIDLAYFGGLSHIEIAEIMQMNPNTVRATLSKCLSTLREIAGEIFQGANPTI